MGTRVLVADDSSTMRKIILRSLQAVGVTEATEAGDGAEAVAAFQPGRFDLVLTDWNMPGKSGLEVTQEIRAGRQGAHHHGHHRSGEIPRHAGHPGRGIRLPGQALHGGNVAGKTPAARLLKRLKGKTVHSTVLALITLGAKRARGCTTPRSTVAAPSLALRAWRHAVNGYCEGQVGHVVHDGQPPQLPQGDSQGMTYIGAGCAGCEQPHIPQPLPHPHPLPQPQPLPHVLQPIAPIGINSTASTINSFLMGSNLRS